MLFRKKNDVIIYGIRRLSRKSYVYVGSTSQPLETRLRRHIMDAIKNRHTNKALQKIIKQSKNMMVADVLIICSEKDRAKKEFEYIMKLKSHSGNRLTNITNPLNPRKKLDWHNKKKPNKKRRNNKQQKKVKKKAETTRWQKQKNLRLKQLEKFYQMVIFTFTTPLHLDLTTCIFLYRL